MSFKVSEHVSWVGKIDWELRKFHGEELSTHRGSSYNSYLIKDEKTALLDTVWGPYTKEFMDNLKKEIDLSKIDYIIVNHGESDHTGALSELLREIPGTPVYCTAAAVKSLKGQYHQDWNFQIVKTGDKLNLGSTELIFVEAPMLHWPDSMFCYLTGDNILFSNDAFGQHYASELMYNDLVDQDELYFEAIKYYANIVTPFNKLVVKKINEVVSFNLPVNMICPSHGIIWRKDPLQIVNKYMEWAQDYQENQITIIYDTMWSGTRRMAEAIAEGIKSADSKVMVKLYNLARTDRNDVITEIFKSKAILLGSPTINKGILSSIAAMLEEIKGLSFKNKKAAAFGTYGWSGESVGLLTAGLTDAGFTVVNEGLKAFWNPDSEARENCFSFGKAFAAGLGTGSAAGNAETPSGKQWRCEVCGYIHNGDTPPDTCPLCGVDSSYFVLVTETGIETAPEAPPVKQEIPAGVKPALFKISYGLFVITSANGDKINGQCANTAFQITSEPATVAIGINKNNYTHEFIEASGVVGISILGKQGHDLVRRFGYSSGRNTEKFAGVNYKYGANGAPILEDCVAYLEGKVTNKMDCGTHTLFLVEVTNGEVKSDAESMTYEYFRATK
jgi:flavorubredoxin/flavin reductase (DIM6/NTAB) family NADH-FMN oxidoreductase RutF/rubredoxin